VLGKVQPALLLVGYLEEVAKAITFIFSDDTQSMQAVMFVWNIGVCSVTLYGDVYKPSLVLLLQVDLAYLCVCKSFTRQRNTSLRHAVSVLVGLS